MKKYSLLLIIILLIISSCVFVSVDANHYDRDKTITSCPNYLNCIKYKDNYDIWIEEANIKSYNFKVSSLINNYRKPFLKNETESLNSKYTPVVLCSSNYEINKYMNANYDELTNNIQDDSAFLLFSSGDNSTDIDIYAYNGSSGTVELDINSSAIDIYPSYSHLEKRIYFSSNRDGDYDIYYIENIDYNDFSSIILSDLEVKSFETINSDYNEISTYFVDNYMLFSSDNPQGCGGYDIYISEYTDGEWSTPVNFNDFINQYLYIFYGIEQEINTACNEYASFILKPYNSDVYNNKYLFYYSTSSDVIYLPSEYCISILAGII